MNSLAKATFNFISMAGAISSAFYLVPICSIKNADTLADTLAAILLLTMFALLIFWYLRRSASDFSVSIKIVAIFIFIGLGAGAVHYLEDNFALQACYTALAAIPAVSFEIQFAIIAFHILLKILAAISPRIIVQARQSNSCTTILETP